MVKSNLALPVVCGVLGLHIVVSLVLKIKKITDEHETEGLDTMNRTIADIVLLVVAGLCLAKCCVGRPSTGVMKGVCVVAAVLMLINSFPELLKGRTSDGNASFDDDGKRAYPERLVYGLTGIVNALVAVACCC